MNRNTPSYRAVVPHPTLAELQDLEREAHRLRAEYAHDTLVRLAIAFDLRIRRLARRVAAGLRARGRVRTFLAR